MLKIKLHESKEIFSNYFKPFVITDEVVDLRITLRDSEAAKNLKFALDRTNFVFHLDITKTKDGRKEYTISTVIDTKVAGWEKKEEYLAQQILKLKDVLNPLGYNVSLDARQVYQKMQQYAGQDFQDEYGQGSDNSLNEIFNQFKKKVLKEQEEFDLKIDGKTLSLSDTILYHLNNISDVKWKKIEGDRPNRLMFIQYTEESVNTLNIRAFKNEYDLKRYSCLIDITKTKPISSSSPLIPPIFYHGKGRTGGGTSLNDIFDYLKNIDGIIQKEIDNQFLSSFSSKNKTHQKVEEEPLKFSSDEINETRKRIKKLLNEDLLPGGIADDVDDSEFDDESLSHGQKHEGEHTKNKKVAKEIAKDHLKEDPKYYKKIEKVLKESLDNNFDELVVKTLNDHSKFDWKFKYHRNSFGQHHPAGSDFIATPDDKTYILFSVYESAAFRGKRKYTYSIELSGRGGTRNEEWFDDEQFIRNILPKIDDVVSQLNASKR